MLTGQPPFVGKTALEIIAAHVTRHPTPVRRLNPSIPKGIADAIERCLAKNPDERFQDVGELSAALQSVTFFADEGRVEAPRNYAMSFFAGAALVCATFAALGVDRLIGLYDSDLWWFVAAFGLLAILTSPVARAATQPLSDTLRARFSRRH
jgi:hypothetical protein